MSSSIAAVIFDLDGVLVDTEIWWDDVRARYAAERGRAWTEADRAAVMGANSAQWSETMRVRLDLAVPAEEIERAVVDEMVRRWRHLPSPLIAGADTAVRRIAGRFSTGLASSAHPEVIAAALAATGLADAFSAVVSSDDVDRGKPAPDVYVETARRLGVEPRSCLVVEDSLNGVLAGCAAGMTVVLVPNQSIPPAAGAREAADLILPDLASLDPDRLGGRAPT